MSCMEYRSCIRAEIKELNGYSCDKAYKYFQTLGFPEPEILDYEDYNPETGIVEFFMYKEKEECCIPVGDYDPKKGNRWGIEYVLSSSDSYGEQSDWEFSIVELNEKVDELSKKFNIPKEEWRIMNYSWYNGGDGPNKFKD